MGVPLYRWMVYLVYFIENPKITWMMSPGVPMTSETLRALPLRARGTAVR